MFPLNYPFNHIIWGSLISYNKTTFYGVKTTISFNMTTEYRYYGVFICYISIEILQDVNESRCRWYCIQDKTSPTYFFLDVKENDIIVLTHQCIDQIIIRPRLALTSLSVKISINSHYRIHNYIRISANSILSWNR